MITIFNSIIQSLFSKQIKQSKKKICSTSRRLFKSFAINTTFFENMTKIYLNRLTSVFKNHFQYHLKKSIIFCAFEFRRSTSINKQWSIIEKSLKWFLERFFFIKEFSIFIFFSKTIDIKIRAYTQKRKNNFQKSYFD